MSLPSTAFYKNKGKWTLFTTQTDNMRRSAPRELANRGAFACVPDVASQRAYPRSTLGAISRGALDFGSIVIVLLPKILAMAQFGVYGSRIALLDF
jgi:hypothetical protein